MTAILMPDGKQKYFATDGTPLTGGKVYTYDAGTNDPRVTYADQAGTIPNTNPVILDSRGEAVIRWDGAYKVVLTDPNDAVIWTVDDIDTDPLGFALFPATLANTANVAQGAALVGRGLQVVGTVAAVRNLLKTSPSKYAWAVGYYVPGDLGGGLYYYDAADVTSVDNGGSVLVAGDGGRWKLSRTDELSVKQFGAKGDDVDDTTAVTNARVALSPGGVLRAPPGIYVINDTNALGIGINNFTLEGEGWNTVFKVKSGANLGQFIGSNNNGMCLKNLALDGNRANGGMAAGSFGIIVGGSHCRISNVEMKNFTAIAIFVGSGTVSPSDNEIEDCYIHDIGGVTTNTGFGVGVFGGGTFRPNGLRIRDTHFENIYNTVAGFPGDSTATNIVGTNVSVTGCYIKNNHNVGGGQLALTSDGSTGAPDGNFIVTNNQVLHDVVVAGENTTAIEIEGRKAVVSDNVCQSLNGDGVRLETSGGDSVVSDNVITCTGNGVNLIQVGGAGPRKTMIHNNVILSAGTGLSSQGNPGGVIAYDNYIDASVPTKIAGEANFALLRGNIGYAPPNQAGMVAGASPFTFPVLNYDALYSCTVVGGMFSASVNGVNVSFAQYVPITVKAGQPFRVDWITTAPTYSLCPQQ